MFLINADLILNLHYCENINESHSLLTNVQMYVCMLFTFRPVNFIKCLTNNAYTWLINTQINVQCRALKRIK